MNQGDPIPTAHVVDAGGQPVDLAKLAGPLVIYFYPKDDTSGCTREAQDFTAAARAFAAAGARVIGVSPDSPASHAKFATKHHLTVELASDPDNAAAMAFGVWGEKKLYGRTYMGVERATFLFGADGMLVQAWRKVRVPGHVEAVLAAAQGL
ncbi:peroxiredoxin [Sphingomonas sp. 1P08PE]|uniref:peroxiredoxin n=1 Tax=Sphingomonas sp. 1P08PE TaxID=554122 RepID=UPI0039A3F55D